MGLPKQPCRTRTNPLQEGETSEVVGDSTEEASSKTTANTSQDSSQAEVGTTVNQTGVDTGCKTISRTNSAINSTLHRVASLETTANTNMLRRICLSSNSPSNRSRQSQWVFLRCQFNRRKGSRSTKEGTPTSSQNLANLETSAKTMPKASVSFCTVSRVRCHQPSKISRVKTLAMGG